MLLRVSPFEWVAMLVNWMPVSGVSGIIQTIIVTQLQKWQKD